MKYPTALILSLTVLTACQQPKEVQPEATAPVQPVVAEVSAEGAGDFSYSPFVVNVKGSKFFQSISFKDVGMKRASKDPNDPMLEVIAESLAQHLMETGDGMMTQVAYDEGLLDPNNHTACGQHHIYVDVWRKSDVAWGYSLWSGCGEDDNFAWIEVPAQRSDDITTAVEPLTLSIVQSLNKAAETSCFRKSC
jgi:hypothetical protein